MASTPAAVSARRCARYDTRLSPASAATRAVSFGVRAIAAAANARPSSGLAAAGEIAVRLNPDNPENWSLYFNAMREAGRLRESREGKRHFDRTSTGGQ